MALRYPIEFSYVSSWDLMEKLWQYTFHKELHVEPENHPVLLTEPPMNPKLNREKTTEVMFETFRIPAMFLVKQAILSLAHAGITTGTVLQSGDGFTFSVPVYEGYSIPSGTLKRELTQEMKNLLSKSGNGLQHENWDTICDIKENLCYVAENYQHELAKPFEAVAKEYKQAQGQLVKVGYERLQCPEALFQPQLYGFEFGGIQNLLVHSIQKCDEYIRAELFQNIVLSGGNTQFPGILNRLQTEMCATAGGVKVKVHDTPDRQNSAWKGGSFLARDESVKSLFIQKSEYDEHGPSVVHRKCCY